MKSSRTHTKLKYFRFRFDRFTRRKLVPTWIFYRGKRLWGIFATIMLMLGIQMGYILFLSPHRAKAAWADDTYAYRQKFAFTHNADVTNPTAITVTINTSTLISAGVLQSDCDDIRFTDLNGARLLYQMTGTCNNAATTYEVVFPTVLSGINIGYLYYGNAIAVNGSENVSQYTQLTPSGGDPSITTRTNEEKGTTPLLFWGLNDRVGTTAQDTSAQNNDGTLTNSPVWQSAGECFFSGCLLLNGSNQDVSKTYSSDKELDVDVNSFTLSAWYRHSATISGTDTLISRYNDAGYKIYMNASGNMCFAIDADATWTPTDAACSTATYNDNKWHNVTAVKNGTSTITLYIDGKQAGQDASLTATTSLSGSSPTFLVGRDIASTNYWDGYIDEIRFYNYAKSNQQVLSESITQGSLDTSSTILGKEATASASTDITGIVGWWKMDEASWVNDCTTFSVLDSSGNGNNGQACPATTGPTGGATGKYGNAGSFNGLNQSIDVADSATLDITATDNLTISAWVKRTGDAYFNDAMFIADKKNLGQSATSPGYAFLIATTTACAQTTGLSHKICLELADGTNTYYMVTNNDIVTADSVWHHIVAVVDRNTPVNNAIYVDGVSQEITINGTLATLGSLANTGGLCIAKDQTGVACRDDNLNNFNGLLDDLRIYKRALTESEIARMYNTRPLPYSYWRFDEGAGTTAYDATSNGNNLGTSTPNTWTENGKYQRAWHGSGLDWVASTQGSVAQGFNMPATQNFSISMWFKSTTATNPTNAEYLLAKGSVIISSPTPGYIIYFNSSGQVVFGITDAADWGGVGANAPVPKDSVTSPNDLYDGTWHHILARKIDTSRIDLYVDGKLDASDTSLLSTGDLTNNNAIAIGNNNPGPQNGFSGDIDETKVYKALLSDEEVLIEYNHGKIAVFGALSTESDGITAANSMARAYCVPGDTTACTPPVGEWMLDENTGTTANDTSGNGNTGTLTNGPSWGIGKYGSGVSFTASNQLINAGSANILDDIPVKTLEAWVKITNTAAVHQRIFEKSDVGWFFVSVPPSTQQIYFEQNFSTTKGGWTTVNTIPLNTWTHIAISYDRTSTANVPKIYFNGVNQSFTQDSTPAGSAQSDAAGTLYIGNATTANRNINGMIDGAKIFNYERTPAQIAWEYNRGGPVGLWKFDECTGNTAHDSSKFANNGTITIGASGTYTSTGNCNSGTASESWNSGTQGKFGSALAVDGVNDYVSIPANATLNSLTQSLSVAAWVNFDSLPAAYKRIISRGSNPSQEWYIETDGTTPGKIYFTSNAASTSQSSNGYVNTGTWYHLVITYNNNTGTQNLYINGLLDKSSTATSVAIPATGAIGIGGDPDGTDLFPGKIDDVRIYNYELTRNQILTIMNENAAVRFGPLTGTP